MIIHLKDMNLENELNCRIAQLGTNPISQCDPIRVVYFDDANSKLNVFSTHIIDANVVGEYGASSIIYNDPDFRINPGDSGGGVYKDGALIANNSSYIASNFFDQNGNWLRQERKGLAYAALLPDWLIK